MRTNLHFFRYEKVDIPTETGAVKTTFYNLNVLNQLAMVCIDNEIILGNFKGNESLPLANRGNTFVSLRGVLEILSKTELSSDIVDNFQDEVFGHLLPSLALTGRAELPTAIAKPDSYMIEDKIERANWTKCTTNLAWSRF